MQMMCRDRPGNFIVVTNLNVFKTKTLSRNTWSKTLIAVSYIFSAKLFIGVAMKNGVIGKAE